MGRWERIKRVEGLKRNNNLVKIQPTIFLSKEEYEKLKELRKYKMRDYWLGDIWETKSLAEYIEGLILAEIAKMDVKKK